MSVLMKTLFVRIISLQLVPFFILIIALSFFLQPVVAQESSEPNPPESSDVVQPDPAPEPVQSSETSCGRPKLAVYTFINPPEYANSNIGLGLTEMLVTNLAQSGRFDVIQRFEDLNLIKDEIGLGDEGYIKEGEEVQKGNVEGVDYYMTGMITYFGYKQMGSWPFYEDGMEVRLDFKIFDASSSQVILAETAAGDKPEEWITTNPDWTNSDIVRRALEGRATREAIENLMAKILPNFPVQACFVNVTPDFYIIDIGSSAGIEEGTEFDVFDVVVLYGPNGEETWREETLIGRIRVTEVQLSSCKAVKVSGENFMVGDVCKLPEVIEAPPSD